MSLRPSIRSFGVTSARRAIDEMPRRQVPERPQLRVVEGGADPARLILTPRRRLVVAAIALAALLFSVVAFHVVLSQGQFALERTQARAIEEQGQYERLRLEVARLESPERITTEAQSRLGMVPAEGVAAVTPGDGDVAVGAQRSANDAGPVTTWRSSAWGEIKPHLSSSAQ